VLPKFIAGLLRITCIIDIRIARAYLVRAFSYYSFRYNASFTPERHYNLPLADRAGVLRANNSQPIGVLT
jgi:hypothetical protein